MMAMESVIEDAMGMSLSLALVRMNLGTLEGCAERLALRKE